MMSFCCLSWQEEARPESAIHSAQRLSICKYSYVKVAQLGRQPFTHEKRELLLARSEDERSSFPTLIQAVMNLVRNFNIPKLF